MPWSHVRVAAARRAHMKNKAAFLRGADLDLPYTSCSASTISSSFTALRVK
jgi:hypothetical protein